VDYIPAGLTLNDANWTAGFGNEAFTTIAGPIAAYGGTTLVDITVTIDATFTGGTLTNFAEITDAEDEDGNHPDDVDSDSDNDPTNDGPHEDNDIENTNDDEDDHDPADVTVDVFDLALLKDLSPNQALPVFPGQDVTFVFTVFNQGTVTAQNVTVTDYIPAGYVLNDSDWTAVSAAEANILVPGPIVAGANTTVEITLTVQAGATGSDLVNVGEISNAEDEDGETPPDTDSTPDNNNDDPSVDGVTDGTGGDEDDHDPATVPVSAFDLALNKVLSDPDPFNRVTILHLPSSCTIKVRKMPIMYSSPITSRLTSP